MKSLHIKHIVRTVILTALTFCLLVSSLTVSADGIYSTYTYGNSTVPEKTPPPVELYKTVDSSNLGINLGAVTDIFYDEYSKILFVVDQGNSRILKIDLEGYLIGVIDSFINSGISDSFLNPTGIFIDVNHDIYICDTGKQRIVNLNFNGELKRIIGSPKSGVLGESFEFKPTHVSLDSINRLYVISTGFNQGVLCLDENGDFLNCMGTPKVNFELSDYLWKLISTKAQKERMEKYVPIEYNNVSIDKEGFLYVTCNNYDIWDYLDNTATPLRKLNAKGEDIIKSSGGFYPYGDRTVVKSGDVKGGSDFVDSLPLDYGMFCAVDRNRGKIFVYNNQSQLLFEFGSYGNYYGTFLMPTAVEYSDGFFAVADSAKCSISIFKMTDYGNMLYETSKLHELGDYEAEEKIWSDIFTNNNNSTIALIGLANVEYRNGDYEASMKYFKLADDNEGYAKSFKEYRKETLNKYSGWIVACCALILMAVVVLFKAYKRHMERNDISRFEKSLEFGRKAMYRPLSHYWDLTWEGQGTIGAAFAIFAVVEIIMILDAYATGYIFAGKSIILTNPFTVVFKMPLLLILYSICNWCVTTLMDGKATLKQIFMANCYALMPVITLIPAAIIMSNFITAEEGTFYKIIVGMAYVWMLILIACANKQIHDYTFGKSIGVLLIVFLIMIVVIFLIVLALALARQITEFAALLLEDLRLLVQ